MKTNFVSLSLAALLLVSCNSGSDEPPASETGGAQLANESANVPASAQGCQANANWVSAWGVTRAVGTSLSLGQQTAPSDTTVRNIARVSLDGEQIRLRLINLSDQPMEIKAASIAKRDGVIGANLVPNTSRPVTFNCGQTSVTIPPMTESFYSDSIAYAVTPEDHLAVSFHMAQGNQAIEYGATWHESYKLPAGSGDQTESSTGAGYVLIDDSPVANPLPIPLLCNGCMVYALRDIEVARPQTTGAWVFLGSSSFHGFNTSQNTFSRVGDLIVERINREFADGERVAVVNRGVGGDTLLNAFDTRFERDVLQTQGVSAVVVWVTNDLSDRSADEIIEIYKSLIEKSRAAGVKVFCPTWIPGAQSSQANFNGERDKLNQWIMSSGQCDGAVDWATPVTAPGGFTFLPQFNSGDFIHSNDAGHRLWSELTPLQDWVGKGAL